MYALVGYKRQCWPEDDEEEAIVALFTSYQKANDYIKQATLKSAPKSSIGRPFEVFRKKSLLAMYTDAYIEPCEQPSYPIDPVIE